MRIMRIVVVRGASRFGVVGARACNLTAPSHPHPTRKTAKTFLAASIFLEVLKVFGDAVGEGVEEKIRYAKWKAADYMKAFREGRAPVPGPPGGEAAALDEGDVGDAGFAPLAESTLPGMTFADSAFPSIPSSSTPGKATSKPSTPVAVAPSAPPSRPGVHASNVLALFPEGNAGDEDGSSPLVLDHAKLLQAQKQARQAVAALQYDDIVTAVGNLEKALAILRPMVQQQQRQ
jgi:vacuolar protein sorting-associated protein VTA1